MSGAAPSPMLRAAGLWEKTSAAGNSYLAGRLGGVRILILKNRDAGTEGEPDWHLFFADGEKRPAEGEARRERPVVPARRRAPYPARPPVRPDSVAMPDDDVAGLWRGGEP